MKKKVLRVYEIIIQCFFAPILCFLLLAAVFSSAGLNFSERTTVYTDSAIINTLLMAGFPLLLLACRMLWEKRRPKGLPWENGESQRKLSGICLTVWAVMMLLFILSTQRQSAGDQYIVMRTAAEWNRKDWSSFAPGGYVNMHTHQSGIILFLYFLTRLVGENNYLAFQLLNIPALLWTAKTLGDGLEEQIGTRGYRTGMYLIFLLFFPLCLYSTFVYGSLPGLALSLAAFRQVELFRKDRKIRHAAACPLLLFLALTMKENSAVFGIGILLFIGYVSLKDKSWRLLAVTVPVLAVLLCHGAVILAAVTGVTGQSYGEGASKMSYIQMGAMENNERYDGWYNRYNAETYLENGCDPAAQEKVVMADFQERLSEFRRDPFEAFCFFLRKNVSQWCDPSFGSIWMNNQMEDQHVVAPHWVQKILDLGVKEDHFLLMNAIQTLIYFGAVLYLLGMNTGGQHALFLKTVFIGGFIFHTFWEANSQYAFPYFVLLIPLATEGYGQLIHLLSAGKEQIVKHQKALWKLGIGLGILLLAILVIRAADVPARLHLFRFD